MSTNLSNLASASEAAESRLTFIAIRCVVFFIAVSIIEVDNACSLPVKQVSGNINTTQTWHADTIYHITNSMSIGSGGNLTIEPGTIIKFAYFGSNCNAAKSLDVNGGGILLASGTVGDPIVFTSEYDDAADHGGDSNGDGTQTTPAPGQWRQVTVVNNAGSVTINHCEFWYGGLQCGNRNGTMLYIDQRNIPIRNCKFFESFGLGLTYIANQTITTSIEITDNTFNNCYNGMVVQGNPGGFTTATITGNELYRGNGTGITAINVKSNSVIGSNTVTGYVDGLAIQGFEYGIATQKCSPQVQNNVIGIAIRYPFMQIDGAFPVYSGNTIQDATSQAIALSGTVNAVGQWGQSSQGIDLPYHITNSMSIGSGGNLTIEPGTIIKFAYFGSNCNAAKSLDVNGGGILLASGTVGDPIVFTSEYDDAADHGGDSNGDGTQTTPAPGQWRQVTVVNNAGSVTINHCEFWYGGLQCGNRNGTMLYIDQRNIPIRNCKFFESFGLGLTYIANQTITTSIEITDNTFNNCYNGMVVQGNPGGFTTATITGNELYRGNGTGITITNLRNDSKTSANKIANFSNGIVVAGSVPPPAIEYNCLEDHSRRGLDNTTALTLSAKNNWWGDESGPSIASNPDGTGDSVSAKVDYTPWATSNNACLQPSAGTPYIAGIVPNPNPTTLSVMQGGTGHYYLRVVDEFSSPMQNIEVRANYNSQQVTALSDEDGYVDLNIPTSLFSDNLGSRQPVITKLGNRTLPVSEQAKIDIIVEPRESRRDWDLLLSATLRGGVTAGSVALGPLGVHGARNSIEGKLGIGARLSLARESGSDPAMTFQRRFSAAIGPKFELGAVDIPGTKTTDNSILQASVKVELQGDQEFSFDDYKNDPDQLKLMGGLFLETVFTGGLPFSPAASLLLDVILKSGTPELTLEDVKDVTGTRLGIVGWASAGFGSTLNVPISGTLGITCPNATLDLSLHAGFKTYEHSSFYDQYPDYDHEKFAAFAGKFDMNLIQLSIGNEIGGVLPDLSEVLPHIGSEHGGEVSLRALYDDQRQIKKVIGTLTADDRPFGLHTVQHDIEVTSFVFEPGFVELVGGKLLDGYIIGFREKPVFEMVTSTPWQLFATSTGHALRYVRENVTWNVPYTKKIDHTNLYDLSLHLDLSASAGVGGSLGASLGITIADSRSYVVSQGMVAGSDLRAYPSATYVDDSFVSAGNDEFSSVMSDIIHGAYLLVKDAFNNALRAVVTYVSNTAEGVVDAVGSRLTVPVAAFTSGTIAQVVQYSATVTGGTGSAVGIRPYNAVVRDFTRTRSLLSSVDSGLMTVTAVSSIYNIRILQQADSSEIDSFAVALPFAITVTDSMLTAAGLPLAFRPNMRIYYWDSLAAVQVVSSIIGDTVKGSISLPGDYFVGVDTLPADTTPPVIEFSIISDTLTGLDTIRCVVSDTGSFATGIDVSSISVLTSDITVRVESRDSTTSSVVLGFLPKDSWYDGTYALVLSIRDQSGNQTVDSITYASVCCQSIRGNVDCDSAGAVDIGDLVYLVEHLFISFPSLCCVDEANCDNDPARSIDIGDLTSLVDHLFITFTPMPDCNSSGGIIRPLDRSGR